MHWQSLSTVEGGGGMDLMSRKEVWLQEVAAALWVTFRQLYPSSLPLSVFLTQLTHRRAKTPTPTVSLII